jgi:threonine/homoserine/homoserine lactone efflux protein
MLISHSFLLVFVTGAAVLLMIPGPAITYIVSRNIGQRRAAGLSRSWASWSERSFT